MHLNSPKRYRQPAFITGMLNNSSIQVDGGGYGRDYCAMEVSISSGICL